MESRLKDKTAIVTGGSRGIGKAIALRLASEGAQVLICGRNQKDLEAVQREFQEAGIGGMIISAVADMTIEASVAAMISTFKEEIGQTLDILVNNVGGVEEFGMFEAIPLDAWRRVFDSNLMATVIPTLAAVPLLAKSGTSSIINIASVAGIQAGTFNCHYGAMKAAQVHITKYLANNLGAKGIRANVVCPSTVKGGVWDRDVANKARMEGFTIAVAEEKMEAAVRAKSPLSEIVELEDVAALVAFLASDEARMITGSCFAVDAGSVKAI